VCVCMRVCVCWVAIVRTIHALDKILVIDWGF